MLKSPKPVGHVFDIFICILIGLLIGFVTAFFLLALDHIAELQRPLNQGVPFHLILIPVSVAFLELVRRRSLYFPTVPAQLKEDVSASHWSRMMWPYHFFGSLLSHLSGASVGREGGAVLFSAALVRTFKLQWQLWGPVCAASGFACITGQLWVAPFFMYEMFGRTSWLQKIFVLLCSWVALLVTESLAVPHLFSVVRSEAFDTELGFFTKLLCFFLMGVLFGYTMRIYKKLHQQLTSYFRNNGIWIKLTVAVLVALFLALPEMRIYQGLGLTQFADLQFQPESGFLNALAKLFLTLMSTGIGLVGGDFIPLVYSGAHLGYWFFQAMGLSAILGAGFGAYLLFAAGTRFKWTSYVLVLSLLGLGWWFWAYMAVSVAVSFSGPRSLYKNSHF